jgi:hypothetical protein
MIISSIPFIPSEGYPAFCALAKGHPDFPASYNDWLHWRTVYRAAEQGHGHQIQDVEVNAIEFEDWCRGRTINKLALLNFAAHKASAATNSA